MTGKNPGSIAALVALGLVLLACSSDPPASPARSGPSAGSTAPLPTGGTVSTTGGQGGAGAPPVPAPNAGTGGSTAGASGSTAGSTGAGAGGESGAAGGEAGAAGSMAPICDEDAGVADEDAGADDCVTSGDVRLQYKAADTNPADNAVKPHFNVVNDGGSAIALADLTIRYWYTLEPNAPTQVFWCDYAEIGCGSVQGSFVAEARMGATHYLQVGFTSGSLGAHADTGEIQTRFNKEDWSNFTENDDYSFDPSKTAFADWHKVTLYLDGMLIWGQEPPAP
jgi:Cellulose binding domain